MIAAVEYGQHQGTRQRHPQSYNVRDTEMWKMIKAGDNRVQKVGLGQDLSKVVTAQYIKKEMPLDDAIRYLGMRSWQRGSRLASVLPRPSFPSTTQLGQLVPRADRSRYDGAA